MYTLFFVKMEEDMKPNFYFLIPLSILICEKIADYLERKHMTKNLIKKNNQIQVLGMVCSGMSVGGLLIAGIIGGDFFRYMLMFSMPFFGIGLLILLAYQSWFISYDKQGFCFRSWYFKSQYYMYNEIKKIERYGTKVTLHMENRKIKMDTEEMKGCTFFLKKISESKTKEML